MFVVLAAVLLLSAEVNSRGKRSLLEYVTKREDTVSVLMPPLLPNSTAIKESLRYANQIKLV